MLSNGAAHVSNGVFLSVVRDDVDHGYLFSADDVVSHAPVALLNLNRAVRFDIMVNGVTPPCTNGVKPPGTNGVGRADVAKDHVVSHPQLLTSSNGVYAIGLGPFQRRHILLNVPTGAVSELLLPQAIVSCVWHPTEGHVLFLLGVDGEIIALDVSFIRHGVAPRLLASITATEIHQALLDRSLLAHKGVRSDGGTTRTHHASAKEAAAAIHFVALAMVAETPGLPTMLLILSSRGDVFSVKVGRDFQPACDATMAALLEERQHLQDHGIVSTDEANELALLGPWSQPAHKPKHHPSRQAVDDLQRIEGTKTGGCKDPYDDALGRTSVFALAAVMHRECNDELSNDGDVADVIEHHHGAPHQPLNALFCVHHVVQPSVTEAVNMQQEYAVALSVHVMDAHAGIHCVSVLYSSGELRGVRLQEKDLLSVDLRRHHADYVLHLTDAPAAPATAPCAPSLLPQWKGGDVLQRQLLQYLMVADGNMMLLKSSEHPRNVFIASLPVWHTLGVTRDGYVGEWAYLEPHRQGFDQVPSPGHQSDDPPPPLATRLPLDVSNYSIALSDDGTILLFPDKIRSPSGGDPPLKQPLAAVAMTAAEFLTSALHAQMGRAMVLPRSEGTPWSSIAEHVQDSILLAAKVHRSILVRGGLHPDIEEGTQEALILKIASAHDLLVREATTVREQREALGQRLTAIVQRLESVGERGDKMRDVLLEALHSRAGLEDVHRTNDVLGEAKIALTELERIIAWREEQQLSATPDEKGTRHIRMV